jgi:hypothetical protein
LEQTTDQNHRGEKVIPCSTKTSLRINPTTVAMVEERLKRGQRRMAAWLARRAAVSCAPADLQGLIFLLAGALEQIGDQRPKRRPTKSELAEAAWLEGEPKSPKLAALDLAKRALLELLIARDLADKKSIGPSTIARAMLFEGIAFEGEPAATLPDLLEWRAGKLLDPTAMREVRDYLRPLAEARLKDARLDQVPRRGFREIYRARIAKKYRVEEVALRGVVVQAKE